MFDWNEAAWYGGPYLQTQQITFLIKTQQNIPGTQQHFPNTTQHHICKTQHRQHHFSKTRHSICEAQHKILPIT